MPKFKDLTGQVFGRLKVLGISHRTEYKKIMWFCECACGNSKIVQGNHLVNGAIQSCGCLLIETTRKKNLSHGESETKLYRRWKGMRERCYYTKHKSYEYYGGRGIEVCDEWKDSFVNFKEWAMRNGFKEELSIDRIDNDGNYEPSNCRWVTHKEQMNNTRKQL